MLEVVSESWTCEVCVVYSCYYRRIRLTSVSADLLLRHQGGDESVTSNKDFRYAYGDHFIDITCDYVYCFTPCLTPSVLRAQ